MFRYLIVDKIYIVFSELLERKYFDKNSLKQKIRNFGYNLFLTIKFNVESLLSDLVIKSINVQKQ